jgi:hypothetical protein
VTCPHCWQIFAPEEILWIAAHPNLLGDQLLGADAHERFLPTRFTVEGHAIDVLGGECRQLACPRCHLSVSRALLEMESLFISILGTPQSGKSYFLTSMMWQLRKTLQSQFGLSFGDADPVSNQIVSDYEETLFLNSRDDQLVYLRKTEKEGDLYESVKFGERVIWYPRPFVYSIQPLEVHPNFAQGARLSRALCLYDNAGEHFLPGGETADSPGTHHLSLSRVLMFLFDPTQHPRFRQACRGKTNDPQMEGAGRIPRQDLVLLEAANRIRAHSGLAQHAKYNRPLVVVAAKYDAWCPLLELTKGKPLQTSWVVRPVKSSLAALDLDTLRRMSDQLRTLLLEHAPEVVTAAEGFSDDVTYIPASALGHSPEIDPKTGYLSIRPRDISPMWAEVPLLYALHRSVGGLVPSVKRSENAAVTENMRSQPPSRQAFKETGS